MPRVRGGALCAVAGPLLLAVSAASAVSSNDTTLAGFVSLSGYPYARCLDGSSSGYYIRKATSAASADSWLFLLDGGGICTTKEDCTQRATTDLGSSKNWPQEWALNTTDLTTSEPENPFSNWNMVYLQYCDGSMHSGARTSATAETFGLWFSGHHTIAATLNHLSVHSSLNATASAMAAGHKVQVVFSGGSAGGVGVFSNYEFVAESLPSANVLGAPVGGCKCGPSAPLPLKSPVRLSMQRFGCLQTSPTSSGTMEPTAPRHRTTSERPPSRGSSPYTSLSCLAAAWTRWHPTSRTSVSCRTTRTRI
jgi:hypothetical protein